MALANDDDVIKTFPSDPISLSAYPLCQGDRAETGRDAQGLDAPDEGSAIRAVAVADQVAWRLVPAAGLGRLTGKSFRIGMGCHTQPQKLAA
jgi:hypothetical protein